MASEQEPLWRDSVNFSQPSDLTAAPQQVSLHPGPTGELIHPSAYQSNTHTRSVSGNSSQVSDGAAAVLIGRRSAVEALGLPVLGVLRASAVVGVPPDIMGIGPAFAIPAALEQAGEISDKWSSCFELINLDQAPPSGEPQHYAGLNLSMFAWWPQRVCCPSVTVSTCFPLRTDCGWYRCVWNQRGLRQSGKFRCTVRGFLLCMFRSHFFVF